MASSSDKGFTLGQIIIFLLVAGIIGHMYLYFFLRKKTESSYDPFTALDPFGEEKPSCPQGQVWIDSLPGCVDSESGFKWPRWLKITRSCPPGFVLDEYKSCVRPYQLN